MKKLKLAFLSVAVSAALASNTFGQALMLTYDGSVHKYTGNILKLEVNGTEVSTDIPPVIIDNRSLVPARAVFEKLGASVKWDEVQKKVTVSLKGTEIVLTINNKKASVNQKTVELDVPAKIINNRTMIPVRFVSEQLNAKVGWYPEKNLVTVDTNDNTPAMASLKKIECLPKGDTEQVTLYVDNYKKSDIFSLDEPERIVVDLPNTNLLLSGKPDIKGSRIENIRYSQYDENTVRVVLDLTGRYKYTVEEKSGMLVLSLLGANLSNRGDDVREEIPEPGTETPKPTQVPTPTVTPKATATTKATATPVPQVTPNPGDLVIKYSTLDGIDSVSLVVPQYAGYTVTRYSGPDRIVVDIPNAKTYNSQQTLNIGSSLIKNIRYSMYNNAARVVLDVIGQPSYQTYENEGELVLMVRNSTYKNITYSNSGDRIGFLLPNTRMTEGGSNLKKLYTGTYDSTGKVYTITYPSSQGDIGSGTMRIDDGVLKSIDILKDTSTGMTSIVFKAEDKYFYEVITRYDDNGNLKGTAITILKPAVQGEKLVVIDPGHGGSEPGASSFGTMEKTFNLDIALRLNKLLKEKGVRTYIIREEDCYVGLYERAYIANDLNATLFLSIHNNANDKRTTGTETLYFPNRTGSTGFTGKRFAQIIQDNLIKSLGTKNRGLVERPNLVVLKATTMPAALAEIVFMDEKSDFAKLQSEDFRQKAAQALCDAIIQSLNEIK